MSRLRIRFFLQVILLFVLTSGAKASHFYGADLFYTHVSGNTYTVTLVAYGDCSGGAFPNFPGSVPIVKVLNGNTLMYNVALSLQAPANGIEVTPVCANQLANTTCVSPGGTVPGVKKFTYVGTVNLGFTSGSWRFRFDGTMGGTPPSVAGRSNNIFNINFAASPNNSSVMSLEATLNNQSLGANSSPVYTTIPTPFFCINKAASFNPGTVDANGDSLSYQLVSGLDSTTVPGTVFYKSGYTPTSPLDVVTGTQSFNNVTGQFSFTPNAVNRYLVVYKVSEYRNGLLVGTSMREMTFVIQGNCNNAAPNGNITNVVGATPTTGVTIAVCESNTNISFNINPTDADGNAINVVATGIPAGASFNVNGNNTTAPTCSFAWNINNVPAGIYNFFVAYTDDGCPLSSKQTIAYTIIIMPRPTLTFNLVSPATCVKKAVFDVTANTSAWTLKIYKGLNMVDSITVAFSSTIRDSLAGGTYLLRAFNTNGCIKDTTITLFDPVTTLLNTTVTKPSCNIFANGAINVIASNAVPPYEYSLNGAPFVSTGNFTGLGAGSYRVYARDAMGCVKDTIVQVTDSIKVGAQLAVSNVLCNGENTGAISVTPQAGFGAPYTYTINSGTVQFSNLFSGLKANSYIIRVLDKEGCYYDTTGIVTEATAILGHYTVSSVTCFGASTGSITQNISGGVTPYTYNINGGPFVSSPLFTGLSAGTYAMGIKDANGCVEIQNIIMGEPSKLMIDTFRLTNVKCFDSANGSFMIVAAGGTAPYTYNTIRQGTVAGLTGLREGVYTVRITDFFGCIKDTTATLIQPTAIEPAAFVANPTCTPINNGVISMFGAGGTPSYLFAIDDGPFLFNNVFRGLAQGTYQVHVRDQAGCNIEVQVSLRDSLVININPLITGTSCYGTSDGAISVLPRGGISPYTISFNNGSFGTEANFTNYPAGDYNIGVKDKIGCGANTIATIAQPDSMSITPTVTQNYCYRSDISGKIELLVTGGTEPYDYKWSHDANLNNNTAANLPNNKYDVRIEDANGCRDSFNTAIDYFDCCTPFIPSAFSPNGDGRNDLFRVVLKGDMQLIRLSVYNRFGQEVFTSNNVSQGWDGSFKGSAAEVGTYFYYVKGTCGAGNERKIDMKGDVVLIR